MVMAVLARCIAFGALLAATIAAIAAADGARRGAAEQRTIERGHYLVRIAGCNGCHGVGGTPNGTLVEAPPSGRADELRRLPAGIGEDEWLRRARAAHQRPPLPAAALRALSDNDLRTLYRYVRHLGSPPPDAPPAGPRGAAVALMSPR